MRVHLDVRWLGGDRDYGETLALQEELVAARLQSQIPDTLLLLEHAPVYTIGRTRDQSSLAGRGRHLPHPLFEISRGGQATYHGPGQLVGYPILDLASYGRDLHTYLRALEESLVSLCQHFEVPANRREGLTGIWVENRKLASIGVGVKKWISWHGFALNVTLNSLPAFQWITPCGLAGVSMTSMQSEDPATPSPERVAEVYPHFLAAELARLRG